MQHHVVSTLVIASVLATTACASSPTPTEETKQVSANLIVARRFVEDFLGGKNPATVDEVVDENVVAYTGLKPDGPIRGRTQYKEIFSAFTAAFPDVKLEIEDMFGVGDRVVVRFKAVATHKGALFGLQPTNRVITMIETHVMRIENGRVVENRVSANNFEFELLLAPILTPMILP